MEPQTQNLQRNWVQLLKKVLFRDYVKKPIFQRLWSMTHTLSLFGMNYGGGGLIESSGEAWVLENVVARRANQNGRAVVFDVGANVGDYSLLVNRLLPSAHIYAFEPAAKTYAALVKAISKLDGAGSIKTHNLGFSDSDGSVDLHSYTVEGEEASVLASVERRLPTQVVDVANQSSESIRVQTIDSFCATEDIKTIDFLKLDVEGHEVAVLNGAGAMLRQGAIAMIQFEFGPANIYSRTFFYDFWTLLSGDYQLFRIIPSGIVPLGYYGEHREVFLTTNYLAVRKSRQ
jgi:FkbM family methyltransferase